MLLFSFCYTHIPKDILLPCKSLQIFFALLPCSAAQAVWLRCSNLSFIKRGYRKLQSRWNSSIDAIHISEIVAWNTKSIFGSKESCFVPGLVNLHFLHVFFCRCIIQAYFCPLFLKQFFFLPGAFVHFPLFFILLAIYRVHYNYSCICFDIGTMFVLVIPQLRIQVSSFEFSFNKFLKLFQIVIIFGGGLKVFSSFIVAKRVKSKSLTCELSFGVYQAPL